MFCQIKNCRSVSFATLAKACAGVALLSLATCSSQRDVSEGVQLILNTEGLAPTTTFELRFDQFVALPEEVGQRATNSPLVIAPRIGGNFVWLSQRSGLFTPSEPMELGQEYHFSLRPGLRSYGGEVGMRAGGPPPHVSGYRGELRARLHRTLRTPPLSIDDLGTWVAGSSNAPSEPEVQLQFNAEVSAQEAKSFFDFRNASGVRIPAEARQATGSDYFYHRYYANGENSPLTWKQQFYQATAKPAARASSTGPSNETSGPPIPNRLVLTPARPLPVGNGWRLVVAKDIPSSETSSRLRAAYEVAIGNVTPFSVVSASADNYLQEGKRISLNFSKQISSAIDTNNWADWISISPRPANLSVSVQTHGLSFHGDFLLNRHYAVVVRAGFPAEESFRLASDTKRLLDFAPLPPRLYFPAFSTSQIEGGTRQFQLLALNVPEIRLRAKQLDRHTLIHALRGYGSYYKRHFENYDYLEPYQEVDFNLVPGRTILDQILDTDSEITGAGVSPTTIAGETPGVTGGRPAPRSKARRQKKVRDLSYSIDHVRKIALDWDDILAPGEAGAVFLEAAQHTGQQRPLEKPGTQALVQLTDLGLVWKCSREEATVYLFSHATGKPIPNAAVWLMSEDNEPLAESKTDPQGLAKISLKMNSEPAAGSAAGSRDARLISPSKKLSHSEARWLMAEAGRDLHAVPLNEHGISLYGFNIPIDWWSEERQDRKVLLFSDRPLYRPGETVHLKGIIRDWQDSHLVIPARIAGTLRCFDSKGQKFFDTNVVASSLGSWAESVPLPQGALGQYRAELELAGHDYSHWFQVQEFQANAFEIFLETKRSYSPADKVELPLSARYYMGKNLSRAKVRWSMEACDGGFAPEGFEDFVFGTSIQPELGRNSSSFALQGEGMLSNKTDFIIAPEMAFNPKAPQPRSASVSVEITDLNQQTLFQSASFVCHSSDFYLGLKRFKGVVREGEPLALEVIAVRSDGSPQAETFQAHLTFQHVEWRTVRVEGAGRARSYRSEPIITNILEQDLTTQPVRRAGDKWETLPSDTPPAVLVPCEAGLYLIEIRAKDAGGREVVTAVTLNVSGKDEIAWNYRNEAQLDLVADQKSYLAGETATVLVKAPFSGTALVTVEREKVMRSFVVELTGNAPAIRVPLETNDAPNVFVSVMLVRGAGDSPKKFKSPEYRLGYCQLNVATPESKLEISIKSDAPDYRPGDYVHLVTEVTDFTGEPVPGVEVTLYAVDEGILSLTGYPTPDPHALFYQTRPLSVRCGVSLPNLLPEDPEQLDFHNKGYLIGGGGRSQRLRKSFLPCAFWNATLQTGTNGLVEASFVAPDSLTRYRVIAVAHSAGSQFGSSHAAFQINKPLMLEPALPRFANVTDHIVARAVVHNQTDQPGDVEVTLQLDDKAKPVNAVAASVPPAVEPGILPGGNNVTDATRSPVYGQVPGGKNSEQHKDWTASLSAASGKTPDATQSKYPLTRTIHLAARSSIPIEFPLEFINAGTAKWIWKAQFANDAANSEPETRNSELLADTRHATPNTPLLPLTHHATRITFSDSVQSTLNIGYVTPLLREIYLSHTEAAETNLLHRANPQLLEGKGTLTVSISNTRLSELGEAISQLLHYPYGCVEQTSSSLLPWLVLRHLPTVIPQLNQSPAEMDSAIQAGIKRLLSMQTQSGGLSYWPGGSEPMLWGSAYGGMAWALASRQGLAVSQASLDRLLNYLSQQLRNSADLQNDYNLSDRCLALYTLALAGRSEAAYHELIFGKRELLSPERRALLALAILETKGPASMAAELLRPQPSKRVQDDDYFGCGSRDIAVRLLAWTHHQPTASIVDVLVEELMNGQSKAHWGTTQGNAWALYALTEYANRVETQFKSAVGTLTLGDQAAPFQLADKATTFQGTFPVTSAIVSKPLVLANPLRRLLFTNVKLETRPRAIQQARVDRGYLIQRTYAKIDDDGTAQDLSRLRVGDSVLISLRIEVRQPAHYVAVDDALPAILEAVNPEFKSQQSRNSGAGVPPVPPSENWFSDFHELRTDRALFFRDHLGPGSYTIRYLARVRAAGTATAPATKVEEMYHPERFGLSETIQISSLPLD